MIIAWAHKAGMRTITGQLWRFTSWSRDWAGESGVAQAVSRRAAHRDVVDHYRLMPEPVIDREIHVRVWDAAWAYPLLAQGTNVEAWRPSYGVAGWASCTVSTAVREGDDVVHVTEEDGTVSGVDWYSLRTPGAKRTYAGEPVEDVETRGGSRRPRTNEALQVLIDNPTGVDIEDLPCDVREDGLSNVYSVVIPELKKDGWVVAVDEESHRVRLLGRSPLPRGVLLGRPHSSQLDLPPTDRLIGWLTAAGAGGSSRGNIAWWDRDDIYYVDGLEAALADARARGYGIESWPTREQHVYRIIATPDQPMEALPLPGTVAETVPVRFALVTRDPQRFVDYAPQLWEAVAETERLTLTVQGARPSVAWWGRWPPPTADRPHAVESHRSAPTSDWELTAEDELGRLRAYMENAREVAQRGGNTALEQATGRVLDLAVPGALSIRIVGEDGPAQRLE
ncbi:hypothetical protein OG339_48875 (plasmid) [Streptosporangium sp. NBC_01495]|uniref:hypothetical protein n=1 Tax=Streptosporangium sp. NBC_01495 TaxID=2903899 RepID=UPI002E302714|nr:hypothetical protein [Streptosporangium sp. NBC_01495]